MAKNQIKHKVRYNLQNFQCGNCETGVVQLYQKKTRNDVTTYLSGCLDCGHEYGIRQAMDLKKYDRDDLVWF